MINPPFRPIYYLGCKNGFLAQIKQAIDELDPQKGRVCDLFSGTGVVGAALGQEREITSVDIQEYARVISSALLNPAPFNFGRIDQVLAGRIKDIAQTTLWCLEPLIKLESQCMMRASSGHLDPLAALIDAPPLVAKNATLGDERAEPAELKEATSLSLDRLKSVGLVDSPDTTVTRYYGGLYFSYHQAAILDAILTFAEEQGSRERNVLLAAALSTASALVNTVGKQFAQPLRPRNKSGSPKASLVSAVKKDRSIDAIYAFTAWLKRYALLKPAKATSNAVRSDYLSALREHGPQFSVVYADPPYTRDHYSRFYHVLETMCLRDNPSVSRVTRSGGTSYSRGVYREGRHQSPFCIPSEAPTAFAELFQSAADRYLPLVLSYSPHESGDGTHPRVVSTSKIIAIAESYFSHVDMVVLEGSVHNKLNSSSLELETREHAEILLKCHT